MVLVVRPSFFVIPENAVLLSAGSTNLRCWGSLGKPKYMRRRGLVVVAVIADTSRDNSSISFEVPGGKKTSCIFFLYPGFNYLLDDGMIISRLITLPNHPHQALAFPQQALDRAGDGPPSSYGWDGHGRRYDRNGHVDQNVL